MDRYEILARVAVDLYQQATGKNPLPGMGLTDYLHSKQQDYRATLQNQGFLQSRAHTSEPCRCYCPTCGKVK